MQRRRAAVALALGASIAAAPLAAQDTTHSAMVDVHGFLQVYYRAGDPTSTDGFRLRKADLKFGGDLSPRLRWRVGFDAAKLITLTRTPSRNDTTVLSDVAIDQRSRILQDAAITYTPAPALHVDVGQQVLPLSLEGTIPSSQVETIERTMFIVERSRGTGLGDVRDIGASANGVVSFVEYHAGVFNETGESQSTTDPNDQKALVARAVVHPFAAFQVGGSGAFEGGPAVAQRRERVGGEIQYRTGAVTARSEAMSARDGELRRFGYYGLAAIRPTDAVQFVARFDNWDRDRAREATINDAVERQITLGVSYLLEGDAAKVAANVIRSTHPNVALGSANMVLVAFQTVW